MPNNPFGDDGSCVLCRVAEGQAPSPSSQIRSSKAEQLCGKLVARYEGNIAAMKAMETHTFPSCFDFNPIFSMFFLWLFGVMIKLSLRSLVTMVADAEPPLCHRGRRRCVVSHHHRSSSPVIDNGSDRERIEKTEKRSQIRSKKDEQLCSPSQI